MVRSTFILSGVAALLIGVSVPALAAAEKDAPAAETVAEGAEAVAIDTAAAEPAHESGAAAESDHGSDDGSSHGHIILPKVKWSSDGILGTYDRASLQRGFQVYREVCSACHSMNRLHYRNLADLGYSEGEIKAIAASVNIVDGPNEDGEMYERPGRPSDRFKSPYPNDEAAKSVNNGALPVDLSLIVKARMGGADYVHAILTGYEEAPANRELLPGQHWNKYMNGNIIAMPAPLTAGQVAYEDGTDQSVDQYSRDVSHFLTWASEPTMETRKRTGIKAVLFLLVFTGIAYAVKRKIWANVH